MTTSLDLSTLSLMDALDLATLIEEEARKRYEMFAKQLSGFGAGKFFATMVENEAKHGTEILNRRIELFGKVPMKVKMHDIYDIEAPETGAVRRGMSTMEAFEMGLVAEQKAYDFYDDALPGITNPEVRELFTELRDEEAEHVEMLKEQMAKLPENANVKFEFDPEDAPYL